VAVLRGGEIVRIGTPAELIGDSGLTEIRFRRGGELVRVETAEPTRVLNELTAQALADGRMLEQLEVRRPTLEDVYLELVDEEAEGE
jgi:ABC-2 type transport system ATP-binding protein